MTRNVPVRNRIARFGLKSYCAFHDGVFEGGPEWTEPSATQLKNIACNPPVPYGTFLADGKPDWVQLASGLWVMSFNGTDAFVDLGTHSTLAQFKDKVTLIVWIYTSTPSQSYGTIMGGVGSHELRFYSITGRIEYYVITGAGTVRPNTGVLGADTWYRLAATYDKDAGSDNQKVYLNKVVITDTQTQAINAGIRNLGKYATYPFEGYMALPRLIPHVKTDAQLDELFEDERGWFGV